MEVTRPVKQKVWGWPGVVNFALGGMGTGLYLMSSLAIILRGGMHALPEPAWFKFVSTVLVGLGFLSLTLEAGWPLRGYHLLRHLRRSWMSREVLSGLAFLLVAFLDFLVPHPVLWIVAAIAALGLMLSHGLILRGVRAVPAWRSPFIPALFLSSGLAMGSGGTLLMVLGQSSLEMDVAAIGLICVVLDMVMWHLYLHSSHDAAFQKTAKALQSHGLVMLIVVVGHLLPLVVLGLLIISPGVRASPVLWQVLATLVALALVVGGVSQKAGIVLRAAFVSGISLAKPKRSARPGSAAHSLASLASRGHSE